MNRKTLIVMLLAGLLLGAYVFVASARSSFSNTISTELHVEERKLSETLRIISVRENAFSVVANGKILPFPADALCQWLQTTRDTLNIVNKVLWLEPPPSDYALLIRSAQRNGYCQDGQKPDKVYAFIKLSLPPGASEKSFLLSIAEPNETLKILITAVRKGESVRFLTHTLKGQATTARINPFHSPRFFNYQTITSSSGEITSYSRLILPAISAEFPRANWHLSGIVSQGETKVPLSIIGLKPRLLPVFESIAKGVLSPCMTIASSTNEFPVIRSNCTPQGATSISHRIARGFLLSQTQTLSLSANINGIPTILETSGEHLIAGHANQVINALSIAAIVLFFIIFLTGLQWHSSRSLSLRVRSIATSLRAARLSPSDNPNIPHTSDPELGELAVSAREGIVSELRTYRIAQDLERSKAKSEIDQRIEKERARAHEDYAYCLRHELRNFVAAVRTSAEPELQSRARLANSLISSMDEIAAKKPLTSLDAGDGVAITISRLLFEWKKRAYNNAIDVIDDESVGRLGNLCARCITSLVYQVLDKYLENAIEHRNPANSPIHLMVAEIEGFVGIALVNQQPDLDAERAERLFRPSNTFQVLEGQERLRGVGLYAAREYALSTGGFVASVVKYPNVEFWINLQRSENFGSE